MIMFTIYCPQLRYNLLLLQSVITIVYVNVVNACLNLS